MKSVCIATFNGGKFITEQLLSILIEIGNDDEIIIVDDKSLDNTVHKIEILADPRIKLFCNQRNMGAVYSFARAISCAQGDIIFLSDQDDIWVRGRVKMMTENLLHSKALLVSSMFDCINMDGHVYNDLENEIKEKKSTSYFSNIFDIYIGKLNYFGCTMAMKKEICNLILPIPRFVESHDLWIALVANLIKSNSHLEKITLHRRIHGNNLSVVQRNILKKMWSRVIFTLSIIVFYKRILLK